MILTVRVASIHHNDRMTMWWAPRWREAESGTVIDRYLLAALDDQIIDMKGTDPYA